MLDYSLEQDDRKTFILNYEPKGEYITVNYASGDDYVVPNTKENRQCLIDKMEQQVNKSWIFYNKQRKRKKSAILWSIYNVSFLIFDIILMCINPTILTGFCIGTFVFCGSAHLISLHDIKKKLKDVEKNKLFLENKTSINDYLEKGNAEVKEDTMIPVREEKEPVLTINDIHDMSYDNVNKIITDIERDRDLGIDRPKVLVKKYLSNKK